MTKPDEIAPVRDVGQELRRVLLLSTDDGDAIVTGSRKRQSVAQPESALSAPVTTPPAPPLCLASGPGAAETPGRRPRTPHGLSLF
jgi:hypothetical protein